MKARILLAEDDPSGRELATFNLENAGYEVDAFSDGVQALKAFSPSRHQLVITDVRMPGLDGLALLEQLRTKSQEIPILVITAYGSIEVAVKAMKQGANDFVGKPFNRDHLLMAVERALLQAKLKSELHTLKCQAAGVERPIIGESEALRRVLTTADKVAPSDSSVLISGETGTGKELFARRIQARSRRSEGPFVTVNCAAIPRELLAAELFGHSRGAFTGAVRQRPGKFRQAHGGTIFLDEVAELPQDVQAILLRVLQEKVIDRVGSDVPEAVDVRVIAATNKNLPEAVAQGAFRDDLYYRLNVIELEIPPLRERKGDIALLARHFVALRREDDPAELPAEVLTELERRAWPGNVRQLQNACERMTLLSEGGELSVHDLPDEGRPGHSEPELDLDVWPPLPDSGLSLLDLERRVIERTLEKTNFNVSAAAKYLSVPRHVLAYRIVKYGLSTAPPKGPEG